MTTTVRKVALTYAHGININGNLYLFREWHEVREFFNKVVKEFKLSKDRRLIVYSHYLQYEFQAMKKQFNFIEVFNNGSERKVLTALTDDGIEFRCSYMLSGKNLSKTAEDLTEHKIAKLDGDLDYELLRTPETPLTDKEIQYILHDILIVEYYIREEMARNGNNITRLQLTNTGKVRHFIRSNTVYNKDKKTGTKYKRLMKNLKMETEERQPGDDNSIS